MNIKPLNPYFVSANMEKKGKFTAIAAGIEKSGKLCILNEKFIEENLSYERGSRQLIDFLTNTRELGLDLGLSDMGNKVYLQPKEVTTRDGDFADYYHKNHRMNYLRWKIVEENNELGWNRFKNLSDDKSITALDTPQLEEDMRNNRKDSPLVGSLFDVINRYFAWGYERRLSRDLDLEDVEISNHELINRFFG